MVKIIKHVELGWRWLRCGGQLLLRNPWLLGGMGFCCAVGILLLSLIPFLGGPLIALFAPIALASFYLAIDGVSRVNMQLPRELWQAALKQSPRELLASVRNEKHFLPLAAASLFCLLVSVMTSMFVVLIAGQAWTKPWVTLGAASLGAVVVALLFSLGVYFFLAIAFVFSLARAFLEQEPLIPEMQLSLRIGVRYPIGVLAVLSVLLVPGVMSNFFATGSLVFSYFVALLLYTLMLPWAACSLYCSYRNVFQRHHRAQQ